MKMFAWKMAKSASVSHTDVSLVLQCVQFMVVSYVVFMFAKNAQ